MNDPYVILVDNNDNPTGIARKMEAHEKALLHRAVSVFIINPSGDWILQKRAFDKYHSNGLWTNACCTHPNPGESNIESAHRRLREEMGIDCELVELFSFTYREELDNGLTEHEYDHVFLGISDKDPEINTSEVGEWKAVPYKELHRDLLINKSAYTSWFRMIHEKVNSYISEIQNFKI